MKKKLLQVLGLLFLVLVQYSCSGSKTVKPEGGNNDQNQGSNTATTPEVKIILKKDITTSSVEIKGKVVQDGGAAVTKRGFCWDTLPSPSVDDNSVGESSISGDGTFVSNITGLKEDTKYYIRAFAKNSAGIAYGKGDSVMTKSSSDDDPGNIGTVWVDSSSFKNYQAFEDKWNYLYPWGSDHNGSARMYASSEDHSQVSLQGDVLEIKATRISDDEGKSTADPYLQIKYHSGAIHLKKQILVDEEHPVWIISGDFKTPDVKGSWPAFWISGAWSWPPESDIMEFKGSNTCWQNTATGPDWTDVSWQNEKTAVENTAGEWHNYELKMRKFSSTEVTLIYSIDGDVKATHTADFVGKPFWLIINLQMEGSSGAPGPQEAAMYAKNVKVISRQL